MRLLYLLLPLLFLVACEEGGDGSTAQPSETSIVNATFFDRTGYGLEFKAIVDSDSRMSEMMTSTLTDGSFQFSDIQILARLRSHVHFYEQPSNILGMCERMSTLLDSLNVEHEVLNFRASQNIPVINDRNYCLVNATSEDGDIVIDPISNSYYNDASEGSPVPIGYARLIELVSNRDFESVYMGAYGHNAPPYGFGSETGDYAWILRDGFGTPEGSGYVYIDNANLNQQEVDNFTEFLETSTLNQID